MSKPPKIPDKPFITTISTKLNEPATKALDAMRGAQSRSAFIRGLIRDEWNRRKA